MELSWFTKKVRVADLKLLDYNPRSITEAEKRKLLRSLETFGLADIPVVNQDFTVISGNQRVKCLLDLGRDGEEIDVRWPTRKLTKTEVKEYAVTANTHNGVWDFDVLAEHFAEVPMADFGVVVPVVIPELVIPATMDRSSDKSVPSTTGNGGERTSVQPGPRYAMIECELLLEDRNYVEGVLAEVQGRFELESRGDALRKLCEMYKAA